MLEQYYALLLRAAVKACANVLERYAFSYADTTRPFGLAEVRKQLGSPRLSALALVPSNRDRAVLADKAELVFEDVHHQVKLGESFASVAVAFNAVLPASAQITAQQIATKNKDTAGLLIVGTAVPIAGMSWTTLEGETLYLILARLGGRNAAPGFVQGFPGLQQLAQATFALPANAGLFPPGTDPIVALNLPIDPLVHPQIAMPPGAAFATYRTVTGDTLIRIAASSLAIQQTLVDLIETLAWVLAHNTLTVTDPNASQPIGTIILLPPMTHVLEAGETAASLASRLLTDQDTVIAALLAISEPTNLLAPQALAALPPLTYAVRAATDTFASIAALFNLTLEALEAAIDVGDPVKIFAAGATVDVAGITEIAIDALVAGLAATQWTTITPMASRFMLAGLRLPDPRDPAFKQLTLAELRDPRKLGAITTLPLYVLTGQQSAVSSPPPVGYQIKFDQSVAVPWFTVPQDLSFGFTPDQIAVIAELQGATFAPAFELAALPLFSLSSSRFTMQKHIAWQPAVLPNDAVFSPSKLGNVAGNPDLWVFPDTLVSRLQSDGATQPPYTIAIGTHENSDGMTVTNARAFAWATLLRFSVQQLPADEAAAPTAATLVGIVGTDDNGIALLDSLDAQLQHDDATLYLLYPPNPASSTSGLLSDQLAATTAIVQTNLSTLSHSGDAPARFARSVFLVREDTGDAVHVAPITNAGAFLRLVRDSSIVRSGGYYLRYVNANGDTGLPATLFTTGPVAELSLLVVLRSQNAPFASILPFNNCAIVADNIDAASSNVFVQSATWLVTVPSSLADAAAHARATYGLALDAPAVATLNADVPQLLRPGATVTAPDGRGGTKTDTVRLDDTLDTLASRNGLSPAALAAYSTNAQAQLLVPTGLVQFYHDALTRTAAIPAGNAGFELTRANPDPDNSLALTAMDGTSIVDELFHMLGHRIVKNLAGVSDFIESGEGIPAGPAQSSPSDYCGAPPSSTPNPRWDYHHAVAIAPFALVHHGSASPALPAAAQSPYAGVDPSASVTFSFDFHDPFGNEQSMPGNGSLAQPVRYFDDLAGLGQWPSSAAAYTLQGDGTANPSLVLSVSMQTEKYLPVATISSARAAQNVATDITTYRRVYYQLAQPDVTSHFQRRSSRTRTAARRLPTLYRPPFQEFVAAAWVVLDALRATNPVVYVAQNTTTTINSVAQAYDISLADLFAGNGDVLYAIVFGSASLSIPKLYTTVSGDSLASIAAVQKIDAVKLARQNPWAPLATTIDLLAPSRSIAPKPEDSLATIALALQCSVSGIAMSNSTVPLADGLALAVAGIVVTTKNDNFDSLVKRFGDRNLSVTVGEIALSNQTVRGIFRTPLTLTIDDIVPRPEDSLGTLQQRFNFTIETLALANQNLADLYAAGTSLYIGRGKVANAPDDGTTLAQFAAEQGVPLRALGLPLYFDLQPATPPAFNGDAVLASTAKLTIPATVTNDGPDRHAPYRAAGRHRPHHDRGEIRRQQRRRSRHPQH